MAASLEDAKLIRKRYYPKLEKARINSTCRKTEDASTIYLKMVTEYHQSLKDIGYRVADEYDDVRSGTLVPITQEWKDAQLAKMSEVDKLFAEARKLGAKEGGHLITKAIRLLAEGKN